MDHQRVFHALVSLGLSQIEGQVYIYLAVRGPQEKRKIAEAFQIPERLLNEALNNLEKKGIIAFEIKQSELVFAQPFYQALSVLLEAHTKETRAIEQNKDEILSRWKGLIQDSTG